MQLLRAGLARSGVRGDARRIGLSDIGEFRAAFFTNSSTPVRAVASIDETVFADDTALTARLTACYETNPLQRV